MAEVVVSEVAATAIAGAITAQTTANQANLVLLLASLEKQFGPAATKIPGTIPAILAGQLGTSSDILKSINAQTEAIEKLTLAMGKVASSVESITTAAANIQYTANQQLVTTQLAVADQLNNNKFQQLTTNAALERAELPPTEVKPDELKVSVTNAVSNVGVVQAQVAATSYITDSLSKGATEGLRISQEWVAQSAFGKFISSYYAEAKVQGQLLFAEEKAKAKLIEARDAIRAARQTAGSSS